MSDTKSTDRSPTESLIRDLYTTIAFFTADPDMPRPWAMTLNLRVGSLAEVEAIGARFGRHEYGSQDDGVPQTDFDIPGCEGRVNVIVAGPRPARGAL